MVTESTLKMEALGFPRIMVCAFHITLYHIPEDHIAIAVINIMEFDVRLVRFMTGLV
jgi:hypothetical protein